MPLLVGDRTRNTHELSDSKSHAASKDIAESFKKGPKEITKKQSNGDISLGEMFSLAV